MIDCGFLNKYLYADKSVCIGSILYPKSDISLSRESDTLTIIINGTKISTQAIAKPSVIINRVLCSLFFNLHTSLKQRPVGVDFFTYCICYHNKNKADSGLKQTDS